VPSWCLLAPSPAERAAQAYLGPIMGTRAGDDRGGTTGLGPQASHGRCRGCVAVRFMACILAVPEIATLALPI
jgi:hypothetical protein